MSSAGAAAVAKGMRQQLQQNYKASMQAFLRFIQEEKQESVVSSYHLIRYNVIFIPQRFLLVETDKALYCWQYVEIFDKTKHASQVVTDKTKSLQVVTKRAGIFDRLNQPSIGEYVTVVKSAQLLPDSGKYVVENLEGFAFQDKEKQAAFVARYQ